MSIFHNAARIVVKHAPTILTGAGTIGLIGTAVLASRATLTYKELIADEVMVITDGPELMKRNEHYTEDVFRKDRIVCYSRIVTKTVKHYAPTIALGVASIAAFWWSHSIQSKRIAGLAAAYTALDASYRKYKKSVASVIGEESMKKVEEKILDDVVFTDEPFEYDKMAESVIPEYSPYARIIDETSSVWDPSDDITELNIHAQLNYMNDILRTRGYLFLSDVYDALGIPRTPASQVVGWLWKKGDGDHYVSFGDIEGHRIKFWDDSRRREVANYLLDFNVDGEIVNEI